jgi:hypothetical protein
MRYRASELFGVKYISDYDEVLKFFVNIKNKKIKIDNILNAFFAYGPQYQKFISNESIFLYFYLLLFIYFISYRISIIFILQNDYK